MTTQWLYQVRFDVADPTLAAALRQKIREVALAPLYDVLGRHRAVAKCQFDAFAGFVAEAERAGETETPLYRWTKAVIADTAKQEKYGKAFTAYVEGREVYEQPLADALEADLKPLAERGLIARLSKIDTNPANNPQAPKKYHDGS